VANKLKVLAVAFAVVASFAVGFDPQSAEAGARYCPDCKPPIGRTNP